ncbi:hypothetical protein FIBSPDRAFT_878251 [Athelia psychrophila]|uniref:Uncharacterized protein n=1 Tax=Athelia psychrophila TaxID=1759441 RepID=A0A167V640_9AGAM|nr:hypothetical protein FIBSPDRAFT_878251 [Fibularhizoctonia sp. CBS 109695]
MDSIIGNQPFSETTVKPFYGAYLLELEEWTTGCIGTTAASILGAVPHALCPAPFTATTLSFCLPSSALCHLPACCSVPRKSVAMSKAPTKLIKHHDGPPFHLHAHIAIQRN